MVICNFVPGSVILYVCFYCANQPSRERELGS